MRRFLHFDRCHSLIQKDRNDQRQQSVFVICNKPKTFRGIAEQKLHFSKPEAEDRLSETVERFRRRVVTVWRDTSLFHLSYNRAQPVPGGQNPAGRIRQFFVAAEQL